MTPPALPRDATPRHPSRRALVSCAAHLALAAAVTPRALRALWARAPLGPVVAREPFGALERVADGIWAHVSTPLGGDRTTLSNGGIVAGRDAVLAVEGFNQPEGARWLAVKARELTGRWPTHVVLTHYHADHANGLAGYREGDARPALRATAATRELVLLRNRPAPAPADADSARTMQAARAAAAFGTLGAALADVTLLPPDAPTAIDLGGRTVRVVPRAGHTASDVSVEVDEPSVVFCGDLVWNGMFPNYVDAVPTRRAASVRALRRQRPTVYVPGHGALAREADYDRYAAMLAEVERAARAAHAAGTPAADAAARFALPASLGEWTLFNRAFFERAFAAWLRELGGGGPA
jgi:glyoxylase-like metal-dependent hydrolase (beta-lactamase superfamily II)